MSTTSSIPDDILPDFFPRMTKTCVVPSTAFFNCLSAKSVKSSDSDTSAGVRGLQECLKEKKSYETCMIKNDPKRDDPKRHRVRFEQCTHKLSSLFSKYCQLT